MYTLITFFVDGNDEDTYGILTYPGLSNQHLIS